MTRVNYADNMYYTFTVQIARQTEKAIIIENLGKRRVVIPKSLIRYADRWDNVQDGQEVKIELQLWKAREQYLV